MLFRSLAILILGARNLETKKKLIKKRLFGLIRKEYEVTIDNKAILADKILSEMTPEEVSKVMTKALSGMQLAFFLALTTSLIEVNLLKKTKQNETTASGLS